MAQEPVVSEGQVWSNGGRVLLYVDILNGGRVYYHCELGEEVLRLCQTPVAAFSKALSEQGAFLTEQVWRPPFTLGCAVATP